MLNAMYKAGCTHLVYGLESFDKKILKKLGKGSSQRANINSVPRTLATGIIPIPNIIIGFPEDDFDTIRTTIEHMDKLGIHSKPHFATAYPGSEWYYNYKDSIIEQYNGDLEAFILDLGDASKITGTICHKFSAMELIGLQDIVLKKDLRLLDLSEKHWGRADEMTVPIVEKKESFNLVKKKINAPIESEVTAI